MVKDGMNALSRVPSVCQRCFQPVPKLARKCPSCDVSLGRYSSAQMAYVVALGVLVFTLIVVTAWLLYRFAAVFIQSTAD
jgi:hypothetical protein